jgi:hypothetical protein
MSVLSQLVEYKHTSAVGRSFNDAIGGIISGVGNVINGLGGNTDLASTGSINLSETNRNLKLVPKGTGIIDIVNDFEWNANYINASYVKIPKLYITEREQQESSLISASYYYISNLLNLINLSGSAAQSVDYFVTTAQKFIDQAAKSTDGVTSGILDQSGDAGAGASGIVAQVVNFLQTVSADFNTLAAGDSLLLGEYLKSYTGIYLTRETGFNYVFPYFSNEWQSIANSWKPVSDVGALNVVDNLADNLKLVKPGVYIERPQYFDFQQSGDSVQVTFPLLNTVSESYKVNYELLWMLAFQNKYYRESFASVRPPKIYSLTIPGIKFMPYAHIESMSIEFAGTRRLLEVSTPVGNVTAPIPDAYIVTLKFKSLLSDTANGMLTNQFHRSIITDIQNSR